MKEENKLMKLELEKENQKLETIKIAGLKHNFFNLIHYLLKNQRDNYFLDYLLIIGQFIQLMAFPINDIFSSNWKILWLGTIGHFFRYFQYIFIFIDYNHFYIICFFITFLYIIIFVLLLSISIHKLGKYSKIPKFLLEFVYIFVELNTILFVPFLKILFNIFSCDTDNILFSGVIQCHKKMHIGMIIISCILIVIFVMIILLFKITYFEFGVFQNKLKATFTSSTDVLLLLTQILLVIIYQFLKHQITLSIITLIISFFIFYDFYEKQPFTNITLNKTYYTLYVIFLWTSLICFLSLLLKNTKFEGAVLLLLLSYPFIILIVVTGELEFTLEKIFEFNQDKYKNGYKNLKHIEYFLRLEESLYDKIRTREQKILYSYIYNYELTCINEVCGLKSFLKIPLKVENFNNMRIYLLRHAEILYKVAISKYPFNAKLRLSYALFLFQKLNKKQQGTNEILLLNKYSTSFEDSFLVFRAQKLIENENIGNSINGIIKTINPILYKGILKNMKEIMGNITMKYIDFWSILAKNDKIKYDNFKKMNEIGNKITLLNEELINQIAKLERANLYDQDTIKLYSQYLVEVLNDQDSSNKYNTKIMELEQTKHQYNEENIFNLNYKAMSRCEDYKYIIISCSSKNFGVICNMSHSISILFGFSKEELIGRPLDYILPELFAIPHKKILLAKKEKFIKDNILKNTSATKIHSDFKIIETFGRNKMKYLVPIKMQNALVSTEEGVIYGVSKIITDSYAKINKNSEIAYVLTDKDYIINSFTANSTKLLNLHLSHTNLNLDITNYISEIRKGIYLYEENVKTINNDFKKQNTLQKKNEIIKNLYIFEKKKKKLISWNIFDIYGKAPEPKRLSRYIRSDLYEDFNFYHQMLEEEEEESKNINSDINRINSSKVLNIKYKMLSNIKESSNEKYNSDFSPRQVRGNDFFNKKNIMKKFYLTVEEVKMGMVKIGYIFKFEPTSKNKNIKAYSIFSSTNSPKKKSKIKNDYSENEKSDNSDISFVQKNIPKNHSKKIIINKNSENSNGIDLGLDVSFIPRINKESEFYLDIIGMSYKQKFKYDKNKNYKISDNILREEAEQKILKLKQKKKVEEEEEESEGSSYDYSSSDEEQELFSSEISSSLSSKNGEKRKKKQIKNENDLADNTPITDNPNEMAPYVQRNSLKSNIKKLIKTNTQQRASQTRMSSNDFYHINADRITLFVYNYSTGFVEALKDPKFKISQMTTQMEMHKERINKSNSKYIVNPKLALKDKKKNLINSLKKTDITDNEISTLNEKKVKLIEIEKVLKSKENQSSIINLSIVSFVIFLLIIGSSIISLVINIIMKNKIFTFYQLIEKSTSLYKNLLYEIFYVREMIYMTNPGYTNLYETDKNLYFLNYSSTCKEFYLETSTLLSSLSTSINTLKNKNKNKIMTKKGNITIIDKKMTTENSHRDYEILIYSAFHEINAALYHISQMKLTDISEFEENIFFFMRNGLNFMLKMINEQIDIIIEEFYEELKIENIYLVIGIIAIILIYIIFYILFIFFYQKVEIRKLNYLSIFDDIGKDYILSSLEKCEVFSQKIHLKDESNINQNENTSNNFSAKDNYFIDNNDLSPRNNLKKINEIKQVTSSTKDISKRKLYSRAKIAGLVIFVVLLAVQIYTYYYLKARLNIYKKYVQYQYYNNQYYSLFLLPFIAIREYIYNPSNTIIDIQLSEYLENTLKNFYINLNEISEHRLEYSNYLSNSYLDYLDDLNNNQQCSFLEEYLKEYANSNYKTCDNFFYNISYYGFNSITITFIEDIRIMKNQIDNIYQININKRVELTNFLQKESYKMNIIIYKFVVMKVIYKSLNKLFETIRFNFDETIKISFIINIIFMVFVFIGFITFWLPFVFEQNETIFKAKNMLNIIPKEVIIDLPNINSKLGIDIEN